MKRILACIIILAILLAGCGSDAVNNDDNYMNHRLDGPNLIQINKNGHLYYDAFTYNVYIWNGTLDGSSYAVAPVPYYDPYGGIYKYDISNNKLVEYWDWAGGNKP